MGGREGVGRQASKQSLHERPDGCPFAHPALMSQQQPAKREDREWIECLAQSSSYQTRCTSNYLCVGADARHTFIYDAASTAAHKFSSFRNRLLREVKEEVSLECNITPVCTHILEMRFFFFTLHSPLASVFIY